MKTLQFLKIAILILVLYLSFNASAQNHSFKEPVSESNSTAMEGWNQRNDAANFTADFAQKSTDNSPQVRNVASNSDNSELDEDFFGYDQDFFSRKIYQRKLPKLQNEEKVAWAFRLAESNIFL